MGMFYIYSKLQGYDLYDFVDFKNAYITWEQDDDNPYLDHQVIREETVIDINIYNYLVCAEILPNKIILHFGEEFKESVSMDYEAGMDYLYKYGYNKVTNYILKECYACVEYAVNGVEYFCNAVAHNKAEQYFLEGHTEYE